MENLYRLFVQNEESDIFADSNDSIFDLVGHKEPDQTKSLGFVLAKSDAAMAAFLKIIVNKTKLDVDKKALSKLISEIKKKTGDRIVDCELKQRKGENKSYRADIIIRFPDRKLAIFVEAKSASSSIGPKGAIIQVENYKKTFAKFEGYKKILATLTSYSTYTQSGDVKNITWSELIESFLQIDANDKSDKYAWLAKEYVNYLLKINRIMFYDIEVLSIPAGGTINAVIEAGVYECPSDRPPYKSRGEHKPLFIAFRGEGGVVDTLYKVSDLISTPISGSDYAIVKESIRKDLVERIEKYKELVNYDVENGDKDSSKWVFFLDKEGSIPLPNNIKYKRNNSFVETQRPLKDYFGEPNKEGYVIFS